MINNYPPLTSKIKSIQRGVAASAGTITISSVNVGKSFARSFSTGSAGTVASNSNESGTLTPSGGSVAASSNGSMGSGSFPNFIGTRTISGGSTSLFSAEYGVSLTNSTTLTATGACRWEVVEYV
jgi:hypothetical protein